MLEPVRRALEQAQPGILNRDPGSQFTAAAYVELVTGAGVRISMEGRGRALDSIHEYESPREARTGIGDYLAFYNGQRLHQALGYRTPAEVYAQREVAVAAEA